MQSCLKCGAAAGQGIKSTVTLNWKFNLSLGRCLFWICLCLGLYFFFRPVIKYPHPSTTPTFAVQARGRDIYRAILGANTAREGIGLPALWPKTCKPSTNHPGDVSSRIYTTSSDYFYEIYDGANVGTERHEPYVGGFDYTMLAGTGVPSKRGSGKLQAQNNMWAIAANLNECDDDRIPVLLTHNVDVKEIERVVNQGLKESEFNKDITFLQNYRSTFWNKYFVVICKDGSSKIFGGRFKAKTLGELFDNKELPPRDPSKPPIVYLMP
jgi:hypothetical protein